MKDRPRLVYIVSDIDKSLHFEWIAAPLKHAYDLSFILIGQPGTVLEQYLKQHDVPVVIVKNTSRVTLVRAWFQVLFLLIRNRPAIVHTHLWVANLIGLTTSWLLGISKRIYTRHHAMVHYDEHPSGLKWDRLCNRLATHIIAISDSIRDILVDKDKAQPGKVYIVPHGFDFSYFENIDTLRVNNLKQRYDLTPEKTPVIGIISRYTAWKGIQYIIPAFRQLLQDYPHAHLVLANAHGDYAVHIKQLLTTLPLTSYTEIRFEKDLAALYRVFDVFVHVPTDPLSEAFGQTYVEPLIVGVPCVFTKSGIARQFITHQQNAYVVSFRNTDEIHQGIQEILENTVLRNELIAQGKQSVATFTLENYLTRLSQLYNA